MSSPIHDRQRLFVIAASEAATGIVFYRKGPWWILAQWDFDARSVTVGASFKGKLYPRRCDLSPDGTLFSYFALKGKGGAFMGQFGLKTFQAISRSPWLFALAAWPEQGTYTRGQHFVAAPEPTAYALPVHGDSAPLLKRRLALASTRAVSYAIERRRGWVEATDCQPRGANDMWDERRAVVLEKPRPVLVNQKVGREVLRLEDDGLVDSAMGFDNRRPGYRWVCGTESVRIEGADWCDWSPNGQLLVAGQHQLRVLDGSSRQELWSRELSSMMPNPQVAPDWARTWTAKPR